MRKIILAAFVSLAIAAPAVASWKVTNGSAVIDTDGSSSLTLTCDNNANTNNKAGWLIRINALDTRTLSSRTQVVFRFAGYRPLTVLADHRMGNITLDSMTMPSQSEMNTLISRFKAASRVTVTLIDDANGTAMEPLAFNLRGSSRAISQVQQSCK